MATARRMAFVSDEDRTTMEKALQMVNKSVFIEDINYERGVVVVGYRLGNYTERNWLEVNVACDSVPTIFHDVYRKVYDKITATERKMAFVSDEDKTTLEKALQMVDKRVFIEDINYERGVVVVGYRYENYTERNWLEVNVEGDIFHDVYPRVYDKIMY